MQQHCWNGYSLEPRILGPKTIDDTNFHTIVAKCIQTEP